MEGCALTVGMGLGIRDVPKQWDCVQVLGVCLGIKGVPGHAR